MKADGFDLLGRIDEQSRTRAGALAIDAGDVQVSYGALAARVAAMAGALRDAGGQVGDLVAVSVTDRAALVSVMLAVWRVGGVFVPLESEAPPERIRGLLDRLRPAVLVHDAGEDVAARGIVTETGTGHAVLDIGATDATEADGVSSGERPVADRAYLYYTSGSTGQPKGIVGSYRALARRIEWEIATLDVRPGTRVSQLVTPTFDPWLRDVLVPLCSGGTICIPPERPFRLEAERLLTWLRDARLELMHCGPTLLNALVSTPARIRRL